MSTSNTPDPGEVFRRRMLHKRKAYDQAPDRLEHGPEALGSYWQGEVAFWDVVSAETKPDARAYLWGRLEGNTEETLIGAEDVAWLKELWRDDKGMS
jgi:hypothetical protein